VIFGALLTGLNSPAVFMLLTGPRRRSLFFIFMSLLFHTVFGDTFVGIPCCFLVYGIFPFAPSFIYLTKILEPLTKLLPELVIFSRGSYDGKRCPHEWHDVITIRSEFEHFLIRVSI
jgi:hypothetical protein